MRLDYSEKVGALRETVDKRPAQKNRPRKEPMGIFTLVALVALLGATYGAGVVTGWFLFKGGNNAAKAAPTAAQPAKQQEPAAAAGQPAAAPADTPLTFYKTLPAGGQHVIGSGVNLKKVDPVQPRTAPAAPPAAAAAPAAQPAAPAASAPAPQAPAAQVAKPPQATAAQAPKAPEAKQEGGTRYLVQLASYHDRREAEAAQAKLTAKRVAAYLVESKVQDKVWYRLRVGKHLSKGEAEALAAKCGTGAAVVAE